MVLGWWLENGVLCFQKYAKNIIGFLILGSCGPAKIEGLESKLKKSV